MGWGSEKARPSAAHSVVLYQGKNPPIRQRGNRLFQHLHHRRYQQVPQNGLWRRSSFGNCESGKGRLGPQDLLVVGRGIGDGAIDLEQKHPAVVGEGLWGAVPGYAAAVLPVEG